MDVIIWSVFADMNSALSVGIIGISLIFVLWIAWIEEDFTSASAFL